MTRVYDPQYPRVRRSYARRQSVKRVTLTVFVLASVYAGVHIMWSLAQYLAACV